MYRKDHANFEIVWSQKTRSSVAYRINEVGSRTAEDCDIPSRLPVRVYSQKQLFYLAKEPNSLISVIDHNLKSQHFELFAAIEKAAVRSAERSRGSDSSGVASYPPGQVFHPGACRGEQKRLAGQVAEMGELARPPARK